MSKVVVQRENAIKIYQHCIVKLNYIYNQEKSRKHQYALYKITADYLKDKLNSIVQTDAKQLIFHVSKELLTIYETPTGNQKQELLRNFAVTYYESLSQIQNLDYTAVLDVTLDEIEGELSDEELEKIEKEEAEKLILENGNPRQEENNNNNNLNQNIHNEEEENMALQADDVDKKVFRHLNFIFKGEPELAQTFLDGINLLRLGIVHNDNQAYLLASIKAKCAAPMRDWLRNANSIDEIVNIVNTKIQRTPIQELQTKLKNIQLKGDLNKFIDEIEKTCKELEAAYLYKGMPHDLATQQTINRATETVINSIPTEAGKNAILGNFSSVSELLTRLRERTENRQAAANAMTIAKVAKLSGNRGRNFRGRGGYRNYQQGNGRDGNQNNYRNNNSNGNYRGNNSNYRGQRGQGNNDYNASRNNNNNQRNYNNYNQNNNQNYNRNNNSNYNNNNNRRVMPISNEGNEDELGFQISSLNMNR